MGGFGGTETKSNSAKVEVEDEAELDNIMQCCSSSYNIARVILKAPMNSWPNSTSCIVVLVLCTMRVDHLKR